MQTFIETKGKTAAKDVSKAPVRSTTASSEDFIKMTEAIGALSSPESMLQQCRIFLETLSTDNEHRVSKSDEDEEDTVGGAKFETPEVDDGFKGSLPGSKSGGPRKRKSSLPPTPGKRGRPRKTDRPSLGRRKSTKTSMGGANDDSIGGWD